MPGNARANRLVCSPLCGSKRTARLRKTHRKHCAREECSKEFSTRTAGQMFCGRSCARKASAGTRNIKRPTVACGACGEQTTNSKFCSTACASHARTLASLQEWLTGTAMASYRDGRLTDAAKWFLLEESTYRCTTCQWGEVNPHVGRPVLHIHYKDGNKRNNLRENLDVLCGNCLSLTPTFADTHPGAFGVRTIRARGRAVITALID